ncbi:unnamed protein product, partial [marine sediment metagenome]
WNYSYNEMLLGEFGMTEKKKTTKEILLAKLAGRRRVPLYNPGARVELR